MKVLFVLAVALVQGLALPTSNVDISVIPVDIQIGQFPSQIQINDPSEIEISHLPADIESNNEIEISHLPAEIAGEIEISHLPAEIELPSEIEISHLPAEIEFPSGIEISHLPAEIELPSGIEISHLPAEIELPSGIEISHLPAELPTAETEAVPACVNYIRTLLEEVIRSLPGGHDSTVQRPNVPAQQAPIQPSACTRCFQKIQLLIEKANSRNSAALTF